MFCTRERGSELSEYLFPLVRDFVRAESSQQPRALVLDFLHDPGAVREVHEYHFGLGVHCNTEHVKCVANVSTTTTRKGRGMARRCTYIAVSQFTIILDETYYFRGARPAAARCIRDRKTSPLTSRSIRKSRGSRWLVFRRERCAYKSNNCLMFACFLCGCAERSGKSRGAM